MYYGVCLNWAVARTGKRSDIQDRESFTRGEQSLAHPRAVCALSLMRLVFTDLQILVYVRPVCHALAALSKG